MSNLLLGFGTRNLRRGDSGTDVARLQKALMLLGISVGSWGADGIFGAATDAAAREYQRNAKLVVDGIVGPLTRAALEADILGKKSVVCVDLSQHNRLTDARNDWAVVARNIEFLILRCGVTRTFTEPLGIGIDAEFAFAAERCHEHKIPFGVYYYGKVATAAEGRQEATLCWNTASPYDPLFYVYDVEENILTDAVINAWADRMRQVGAKKIGIYIGGVFYTRHIRTLPAFDFIWYPRYGKDTGLYDPQYAPPQPCDLHQYTSKGKLPGINHPTLDLNRLTGAKPLKWFLAG